MSKSLAKEKDKEKKASQLPSPKGYKILIALPEPDEYTTGMVLELGPDAYSDPQRFPSGAFCKEGDWIVMRSYSGTRFKVHGKEFRLINDDSVEAVVQDPRGIGKV